MAAYGAFRRRYAAKQAGETPPVPHAERIAAAEAALVEHAAKIAGLAMTGAILYVSEDEEDDGTIVTTVGRRPVFARGVRLNWKSAHVDDHDLIDLKVEGGGLHAFAADLTIADASSDNLSTTVTLHGDPRGADIFISRLLNPND